MNSFGHRPRLRRKVKHILISTMLCCRKRKDQRMDGLPSSAAEEGFRPRRQAQQVVVQRDFRRVSGISSEVFRQIEAVENERLDAATASRAEAASRGRGEMILRLLDPATLGRAGAEAYRAWVGAAGDAAHLVRFVEVIKRPGQTLGLYIREGDGLRETEGVFISRIALESAVYNSGLLRVGDEILAVNLVDVRRMSLDDVVIVMSIPRRLVLAVRSRVGGGGVARVRELTREPHEGRPPVVVIKKDTVEDSNGENSNSENGALIRARTKGLPPEVPAIAVKLGERDVQRERHRYDPPCDGEGGVHLAPHPLHHLQAAPRIPHHHHPYHYAPPSHQQYAAGRRREEPPQSQPRWVVPSAAATTPRLASRKAMDVASQAMEQTLPITEQPKRYAPPDEAFYPHHRRTRSMAPPPREPDRGEYWGGDALRRSTGMLKGESELKYPDAPAQRREFRVSPTVQHRARLRRYEDSPRGGAAGILRRADSASDTECGGGPHWAMSYGGRSNSLPRARPATAYCGRRRPHPPPGVRFTTAGGGLPYDSQEESDGAVSAPELPASRSLRRRPLQGRSGVFTSNEYRDWMSRAPSTSALYERLRRGHRRRAGLRVAYSAESLLDTVRQDEYGGIYTFPRRLHTPSEDSLPGASGYRGGLLPRMSVPHPTPTRPSQDRLHLLSLDPRDFSKYRPRMSATTTPVMPTQTSDGMSGYSGLLWIHLLSGRGLRPASHGDHFRDLYCVIEVDRTHKARTVVRTGEHSFDWDEVFEVDLVQSREIAFLLYTWDPRFRHKLCYKGVVHLSALFRESCVHSLALKMEPRGTLYMKLRYKDSRHAFQRMPAPTEEGVFGVDIESVLVREDSGYDVPLIVKRCTEEVERRGMDIVGIYRLCGSALRKKLLREEFEHSALMANLSVEHVPDINVVTSLLKDYLRELPDPLLSKSLYDMLVDGLSVCLPDDPDGNAKLMFSILECLPKANLCTVLLLLDHLRLIASHADRNKMTARCLATAFGPALVCHAEVPTAVVEVRRPIDVVQFLVEMWPHKRSPRLWYDASCGEVYRMLGFSSWWSSCSSGSSGSGGVSSLSELLASMDTWCRHVVQSDSSC